MINQLKIFFCFIVIFFIAVETLAQDKGTIEGTVKTSDGKPIPGVTVIFKNTVKKLTTDFDGKFVGEEMYPGKFTVFAFKYGYKTFMKDNIQVIAAETTRLDITLESDPINQGCGTITGQVVDKNNKPVAGAKIIIAESYIPKSEGIVTIEDFIPEGSKIEARSDHDGKFVIKNIPPGRFTAFVKKEGYKSYMHFSVYVETDKTKTIDISLQEEKYSTIIGTIKSTDGEAIPGANIILTGTRLGAASDASGNFIIREVPPGKYIVNVSMLGFKPYQQSITVSKNKQLKLNIVIEPDISFKLHKISELQAYENRLEGLRLIYFLAESPSDREQIKKQLRTFLRSMFEYKEKEYALQIEAKKKNIEALERLQKYRAKHKDEIIERRLKELLTVY